MFSLISGFYQWFYQGVELRFLILGLDCAGKTTFLESLKGVFGQKHLDPNRVVPTIGLNTANVRFGNFECSFWDVGGQTSLRKIWPKFYDGVCGIIFMVDSADANRFSEIGAVLDQVLDSPKLANVPLIVLNKNILYFQ